MNFDRYCKTCGSRIEFTYDPNKAYCDTCKKELTRKDTIADYTLAARVEQLKSMHNLMRYANDESIYMTWIYRVPDEPSDDDFVDIAINDEEYNACFDLFLKLIAKDGNRY